MGGETTTHNPEPYCSIAGWGGDGKGDRVEFSAWRRRVRGAFAVSWLRIDDGFASHPKIAQLTDREYRVWGRVLCYCAKYHDPTVDNVALSEIAGLSSTMIARFETGGLLDAVGDSFEVHDWVKFQPKDMTGAARQAKWRARNGVRNAVSNGLRAVE